MKILQHAWDQPLSIIPPVCLIGTQNPKLTRILVFVPGKEMREFSTNGLSSPPRLIRVKPIDAWSERETLAHILRHRNPFSAWPEKDKAVWCKLQDYVYRRNYEIFRASQEGSAHDPKSAELNPVEPEDQETTLRHSRAAP